MVTRAPAATPDVAVLHGDAYDLLPSLDPGSVDLLITSPPYWGHRVEDLRAGRVRSHEALPIAAAGRNTRNGNSLFSDRTGLSG